MGHELDDEMKMMLQAYARTFNTPHGQLVLEDLCKSCYLYKTTFVPGDVHATVLNEGLRQVVVLILDMLRRAQNQEDNPDGSYNTTDDNERTSGYDTGDATDLDTGHLYGPWHGDA